MTHIYYQPIAVTLTAGKPATIRWRGVTYRVLELNEPWHLMDRWWEAPGASGPSGTSGTSGASRATNHRGRSDRTYYRLRCASAAEDLTCDIYFEAVSDAWILERVYD